MADPFFTTRRTAPFLALATACALPSLPSASHAQSTLAPVVVTGKAPVPATVAGWGDVPLDRAPLAATTIDAGQIRDAGARRLADLVRFDPAVTSAYDTEGYIDYFTVRGFVIDNRFNFRRDGLPINAETSIPLENKARVDILKGTSGIQAGTSSPGGLVDLVVKRPLDAPLRSAFVEWRQRGSVLGAVDLSQRFGVGDAFGLRLNAGAERLDPLVRDARGDRRVLALAGDWRVSTRTLVEAEVETSHRSQPSVPGFSLLGPEGSQVVPPVPDARLNLNDQPWSQPVVFDATTASVRVTQQLGATWRVVVHGLVQRLRTDDRIAFPFGCSAEGNFRNYCSDGTFDLYDFRSENERRRSSTLDVTLRGSASTGTLVHELAFGAQRTVVRNTFQDQVYNFAGIGNIDGTLVTPPSATDRSPQTDRSEHSTELSVRDAIALGSDTTAWLGARHTRLSRDTSPTSSGGDLPTAYRQSFTTPFVALSRAVAAGQIVYASWGRGVESDVVPNRPGYTNAGQALPSETSRQFEVGTKGGAGRLEWTAAAFDIRRPYFDDVGGCDPGPCTRRQIGDQRHKGVEASLAWRDVGWGLRASGQWLRARLDTPDDPTRDGHRPPNVPARTARVQGDYAVSALPGLSLLAAGSYESTRAVLPDSTVQIPSVTKFDLGARYEIKATTDTTWTVRAGVDNVFDRRAWREAPYQFNHAYLFPLEPRTFRVSLQVDL